MPSSEQFHADQFRVVSYNLNDQRIDERHSSLIRCLEQLAPHVLCTQEGSPKQLYNIQQSLSHPDWLYTGEPFDEWDTANAIFYRSDLFELVQTDTFWLNENPRRMARGWNAPSIRACTWVDLCDKNTDRRLLIYNVHLDAISGEARYQSILLVLESIREEIMSEPDLTLDEVLITGDFNNWPEEVDGALPIDVAIELGRNAPEIQILKDAGFVDTCPGSGLENFPTFNRYKSEPYGPKIDFIWCQKKASFCVVGGGVSLYRENGQYCSDHCPVYADLRWRRK